MGVHDGDSVIWLEGVLWGNPEQTWRAGPSGRLQVEVRPALLASPALSSAMRGVDPRPTARKQRMVRACAAQGRLRPSSVRTLVQAQGSELPQPPLQGRPPVPSGPRCLPRLVPARLPALSPCLIHSRPIPSGPPAHSCLFLRTELKQHCLQEVSLVFSLAGSLKAG